MTKTLSILAVVLLAVACVIASATNPSPVVLTVSAISLIVVPVFCVVLVVMESAVELLLTAKGEK